jgi:hypothetical protein
METLAKTKSSNEVLRELLTNAGLLKNQPAKTQGSSPKK